MTINTVEVLKAAEMVAETRQMKVTLKCSAFGAGITGLTTFVGGLVGGPLGLLAGAVSGGYLSYCLTKNKFKPLVVVLREDLTPLQREKLANHLHAAIKDVDITDAIQLIAAVSSQKALAMIVLTTVKKFIEKEYKAEVTYI